MIPKNLHHLGEGLNLYTINNFNILITQLQSRLFLRATFVLHVVSFSRYEFRIGIAYKLLISVDHLRMAALSFKLYKE